MSRAFVVMTALPPTKGHLQLLQFSGRLAHTTAIVCTQPDEPFAQERFNAIHDAAQNRRVEVRHFHQTVEQNPEAPGFWDMWRAILDRYGFQEGDYIVASEHYGKRFADEMGGKFMPYDIDRTIYPCKGTDIRTAPVSNFDDILPEFQKYLRQTVTFIGAESTGKTTLSRKVAARNRGYWLQEWARPYLEENKVEEITYEAMNDIWAGQKALQDHAFHNLKDKPWVFQDTDLFATVGYWDFWKGDTPLDLIKDAFARKSDLYIIPQSNIPFEPDPIRYGPGERESQDDHWINLCKKYKLNYEVLTASTLVGRILETQDILADHFDTKVRNLLAYERAFN